MPVATAQEVYAALRRAGFSSGDAAIMTGVAKAESRFHTDVENSIGARGTFQILRRAHPEVSDRCAFDLDCAARASYKISGGGSNFTPWTTYNNMGRGAIGDPFRKLADSVTASKVTCEQFTVSDGMGASTTKWKRKGFANLTAKSYGSKGECEGDTKKGANQYNVAGVGKKVAGVGGLLPDITGWIEKNALPVAQVIAGGFLVLIALLFFIGEKTSVPLPIPAKRIVKSVKKVGR